jgi:electron transfer flavoprotein alpha subunit
LSEQSLMRTRPGLLVFLETEGAGLSRLSVETAWTAVGLGAPLGRPVDGVLLQTGPAPDAASLAETGLSAVLVYQSGRPGPATSGLMAAALTEAAAELRPEAVLLGASELGREVAPLAAAALQVGLTAECSALNLSPEGLLIQTRPAFGGDLMAEIVSPAARPQMATVRAGRPRRPPKGGPPLVLSRQAPALGGELKVLAREPLSPADDLEKAAVVLAVGLGLGSREAVLRAGRLAAGLGAALGGSRAVAEQGWLPPERQIGLSGRSVAPDLLITLGVSGSLQFMAGAGRARRLLAVDRDPRAPILAMAHTALIADVQELLPALEALIERRHSEASAGARGPGGRPAA